MDVKLPYFLKRMRKMKSTCELIQAKDGSMVPFISRNGETFRLGSLYNGRYAASRWIAGHVQERMENVILFGLGDLQIVLQLLRKIPGYVLVYEPDPAIYHAVRQSVLFSKFQKEEKLYILYGGEDQYDPLGDLITDILNDDCVERTAVLTHPGYITRYEKEYQMLMEICSKVCDAIGFTQGALQRHMKVMVANQLDNLKYLKGAIPVARLAKYWDPEVPVIMAAAGPSLQKNIGELKNIAGKAFLFAADAALPTLLRNGIKPDLVGSTDGLKKMNCFAEPGSYDIPYMVASNTKNDLMKQITGKRIWTYDHAMVRVLFERHGVENSEIPAQFGIATGIFAMLLQLNVKKIILVGQDLAYSESGKSHLDGRNEGFNKKQAHLVDGYYGKKVYTRVDWDKFREWFESMIRIMPKDRIVINATEGGARIEGTIQKTLKDVVDELPDLGVNFQDVISDERVAIRDAEYRAIMSDFKHVRTDLEKIKKWGYRKTFFENDYHSIPIMDLVLGFMRYLKDVPEREDRFEQAVDYIYDQVLQREELRGGEGWS